jgi:hypothetical protein
MNSLAEEAGSYTQPEMLSQIDTAWCLESQLYWEEWNGPSESVICLLGKVLGVVIQELNKAKNVKITYSCITWIHNKTGLKDRY